MARGGARRPCVQRRWARYPFAQSEPAHLARKTGRRARAARLTLNTAGRLLNQPLELQMSARGGLTETRAGMGWVGTLSQLESRGWIAAQLKAPMTVRAGPHMLILGAAQLAIEDAQLDLRM